VGPPLDVVKSERQIWLVKVPGFVDKAWRGALERAGQTGETQHVGQVSISASAGGVGAKGDGANGQQQDFKLQLTEALASAAASTSKPSSSGLKPRPVPLDYAMVPAVSSKDLTCMHALSKKPSGSAGGKPRYSLEGKVGHQFVVQPKISKSYRQISRERTERSAIKSVLEAGKAALIRDEKLFSTTGTDDGKEAVVTGASAQLHQQTTVPLPVSYVGGARYKREMGRKQSDFRRVKMESKDALMNWIFELFRREPFWSFADIQKLTNQPTRFLMEVLKECAEKVHEGENVNKWQLKDQYRV